MDPLVCSHCKSRAIDFVAECHQNVPTYFVCSNCGLVLEEDNIQTKVYDDELWDEATG